MNKMGLKAGQRLHVLVPYAERFIPCETQVLTTAGSRLTISPPERHRVRVPLVGDHIVLKLPGSDALYELRCPTEQLAADAWAITLPGKDGTTRIQRREFVRVTTRHACRLMLDTLPGEPRPESVRGELVDLSGGGCAVRTDRVLEVGAYVTLVCPLFEGDPPCRLRGKVVRSMRDTEGTLMAVEFRGLDLPLQNSLVQLVQTLALAAMRGEPTTSEGTSASAAGAGGRRYDRSRFSNWVRS